MIHPYKHLSISPSFPSSLSPSLLSVSLPPSFLSSLPPPSLPPSLHPSLPSFLKLSSSLLFSLLFSLPPLYNCPHRAPTFIYVKKWRNVWHFLVTCVLAWRFSELEPNTFQLNQFLVYSRKTIMWRCDVDHKHVLGGARTWGKRRGRGWGWNNRLATTVVFYEKETSRKYRRSYTTRANMENERESKLCCVLFTSISFIVLVKHGVCKTPVRLY